MRSTFMGINIATTALKAQQLALDTVAQNVANASTEGYTRRRVEMSPFAPMTGSAYGAGAGQVGNGVQVDLIERLKNQFLDRHYREENALQGSYDISYEYMQRAEAVFSELDGDGILPLVTKFFDSWHEASQQPDNISLRKVVAETGGNLAKFFNGLTSDLQGLQADINDNIANTVTEINKKVQRVAELNTQIKISLAQGDQPNDLLDQRDLIVDQLSKITDLSVEDSRTDRFKIIINGRPLVEGDIVHPLEALYQADSLTGSDVINASGIVMQRASTGVAGQGCIKINGISIFDESNPANNVINTKDALINLINSKSGETGVKATTDESNRLYLYNTGFGTHTITIESDGNGYAVSQIANGSYQQTNGYKVLNDERNYITSDSGELKGMNDTLYSTIPDLLNKLDKLASAFITRVNDIHEKSYDLSKNTGIPFFKGTDASNISICETIVADPYTIAMAGSSTYPPGDGSKGLSIANLQNSKVLNGLSFTDYFNSVLTDLGNTVDRAGTLSDSQKLIVEQIATEKESVSGVNMDEEMANLVQFQRSYAAAARVMNAMDEILDKVVNGLGLVGR